jgi:hypothetical protein
MAINDLSDAPHQPGEAVSEPLAQDCRGPQGLYFTAPGNSAIAVEVAFAVRETHRVVGMIPHRLAGYGF